MLSRIKFCVFFQLGQTSSHVTNGSYSQISGQPEQNSNLCITNPLKTLQKGAAFPPCPKGQGLRAGDKMNLDTIRNTLARLEGLQQVSSEEAEQNLSIIENLSQQIAEIAKQYLYLPALVNRTKRLKARFSGQIGAGSTLTPFYKHWP